jgi:phenylalanyl-tRNA synthetase beta chain
MRLSERWLRDWVDPPLDTRRLAERLTMAGLEVEAIEPVAPPFSGVVVGRVLEVAPHPNADRLRVCRVDVGEAEPLTIVCGASNVAPGMRAPVALIGAVLPGGTTLAKSRLRGVDSHGMLCSAAELGLGEAGEGLMPLDADASPGLDLRACLELDDVVLDIGLTPNRGDCLGVEGIAREVAALCAAPLRPPARMPVAAAIDEVRAVELLAPEACPRYLGRVVRGLDPAARTPHWMRERLRRSGLRSHGPVIDVTNYILLELGQPMHAFDAGRLRGHVRVRHAREGEAMTLLDGQRLTLAADMLVIADDHGAAALAGIMGGAGSAVGADTQAVFLECAFFSPSAIAGRARRLGLQTDSSFRFERGVDPALQARAMERATRLILDIAGGEAGPVVEAVSVSHLPARNPIRLRAERLERLLGTAVAGDEVAAILERLGMEVTAGKDGREWQVVPPSFRFDLALEADLIEEVARMRGYDRIAPIRPRIRQAIDLGDGMRERIDAARRLLACRDYREAITFSFIDEDAQRLFEPAAAPLRLSNPIATDAAVMRASLWPGLAQAALHNVKRQQSRVRLFESGVKFSLQADAVKEESVLAGLLLGDAWEEQWGLPARPVDLFDAKGDVEALLRGLGAGPCRFVAAARAALHPGRTARIDDGEGREIGWVGELHPDVAAKLGLTQAVVLFEILVDRLARAQPPAFREPSRFPAVRRDLAFIVDRSVPADVLLTQVREAAGPLLQGLSLFDIYQGKGVDSGKKSVAMGLTFQDFSRTLTDTEIGVLTAGVIERLRDRLGASLRE